jgi:hypothetical protein
VWTISTTHQYDADYAWYDKKRPRELAAVLRNVERYLAQLNASAAETLVTAGYMHSETHGVWAIDQKGGNGSLQETRLYVYPDVERKVLWLITIGNKDEQPDDVQKCRGFAESLRARK